MQQCPYQIILVSNRWENCLILCLVEQWHGIIQSLLLQETRKHWTIEVIGTHSNCKRTATHASRLGCSAVTICYQGRWAEDQKKHVVDKSYISTDHQYEDAYVASFLCGRGAIKYELKLSLNFQVSVKLTY